MLPAEAGIGRPWLGNRYVADLHSPGVHDGDSFSAEIDVSTVIECHPVCPDALKKQASVPEAAVRRDGIRIDLVGIDVGDIKCLSVGGAYQTIRLFEILCHFSGFSAAGWQIIDVHALQVRGLSLPVIALIIGVREVNASAGAYPYVIGPVHANPLKIVHQYRDLSFRINRPELIVLVCAGDQISLFIEEHAVGPACGLQKNGKPAIGAIFPDAVVGLISEEHVPLPVGSGAFRELELVGYPGGGTMPDRVGLRLGEARHGRQKQQQEGERSDTKKDIAHAVFCTKDRKSGDKWVAMDRMDGKCT